MQSLTTLLLTSSLLPLLAHAQTPITTSMLLYGDTVETNYVASVIASNPTGGETLFVTCAPDSTTSSAMPMDTSSYGYGYGNDCPYGPGITVTLGPSVAATATSAYDVTLVEGAELTLSVHCGVVNAASTALCTQLAAGAQANSPGTSIYTADIFGLGESRTASVPAEYDDMTYFPLTITAGMEKLGAAGGAVAASTSSGIPTSTAKASSTSIASPSSIASMTSAAATAASTNTSKTSGTVSAASGSAITAAGIATSAAAASATGVVAKGDASKFTAVSRMLLGTVAAGVLGWVVL